MVKLPNVVGFENGEINGEYILKQMYADGSYGIDVGYGQVEVHYPDNAIRVFARIPDDRDYTKKADDYYITVEKLPDGTEREWKYESGKTVMCYEKLSNGEERSWRIYRGRRYIASENIPGEVIRTYKIFHERSGPRNRPVPGAQFNYLFTEEFADGSVVSYYPKSNGEKCKCSEKLKDGTEITYYKNGVISSEKKPSGEKNRWDEKGNKIYEELPNGEKRQWQIIDGMRYLAKEVVPGKFVREYKVTENKKILERDEDDIIRGTGKRYLSAEEIQGIRREYNSDGVLCAEEYPDGKRLEYRSYKYDEYRLPHFWGTRTKRYLCSETWPNGDKKTYYPSGKIESFVTKNGLAEQTWYVNGVKKYEKNPDGSYKCWNDKEVLMHEHRVGKTVIDYKYDNRGNLIYHATNGEEDTVKYLAMKRVAERQAEKSEKLRVQNQGVKNAPQTVKKLNVVQKAIQMAKARIDVKRELRER